MNYEQAVAFLDARVRWGMRPGTDRIAALMDLLDHPQLTYPCMHVSGTNGKYSVAVVASTLLDAFGYTVGTYTSPHLEDLRERIVIGGEPIDEASFAATLAHLVPYIDVIERDRDDHLTYFEMLTAVAFEAFFDRVVHAAVVEAGLGGEYDATNVVDAKVAVVTRVAMDHVVEFEGSLTKAAWEKAGIAKSGTVVVSGVDQPELADIVQRRADERGAAAVWALGREIELREVRPAVGGQIVSLATPEAEYRELFLPLHGAHQAANAALGIAACEAFTEGALDEDALRDALWRVRVPGRLEVVARHPLVVLDGGHNPDAAAAALHTVSTAFAYERATLVVGMLADKLVEDVLTLLAPAFDDIVVTTPRADRAERADRLVTALDAAGASQRTRVEPDVPAALASALDRAGDDDLVLVFGSFYTAGEARAWLRSSGLLQQA